MYKEDNSNRPCDCICRFSADGEITPLKIQFVDDDGNKSEYMIKAYKVKSEKEAMLTAFFEEHKHFPRFLKCKRADDSLIINFESATEHFLVDDASESDEEELSKYMAEYHRWLVKN